MTTFQRLTKAANLVRQIEAKQAEFYALMGGATLPGAPAGAPPKIKRIVSAATKRKMQQAAKQRWAKARLAGKP